MRSEDKHLRRAVGPAFQCLEKTRADFPMIGKSPRKISNAWKLFCAVALFAAGSGCSRGPGVEPRVKPPALRSYDAGAFTIEVPGEWQFIVAGHCSTLSFLAQDPSEPLRKVFYFGQVGPFYMSEQQKMLDHQYVQMGGYPNSWLDMPVVNPLTAENFVKQFPSVAISRGAQNFMPQCPRLENLQVVSSAPQQPMLQAPGAQSALVRGVFQEGGRAGEGLFMVTVAPFTPFTGGPGGGTGYGYMFMGITAPVGEFDALQPTLTRVLNSFNLSQAYVQQCMQQQDAAWAGVRKAGQTLSEASDMIMDGWQRRNRSDDIMAAKRSDAILSRERLYDPGSGKVYEFENGFYDKYKLNPQQYRLNNLQQLPNDHHDLWTAPTLDGPRHL